MAQLPPKIPTISQNCPHFPHQRGIIMSTTTTPPPNQHQQLPPSWVDEFLDFSSSRRGNHRRSVSDSIAFLETPFLDDCGQDGASAGGDDEFNRLDEEQLISMFSDDIAGVSLPPPPLSSASNTSSPSSEQNSNNNEEKPMVMGIALDHCNPVNPKSEAVEDETSFKNEAAPPLLFATTETVVDPKRVKRILANRQSAQRSRVRKLQYISELERSVTNLQTEVSALSPRVAFLDHQRLILNVDNSTLKQRIAALAQDKIFKDAHQDALKKEIERLRQIYHQQSLQKMGNNNNGHSLASPPPASHPQHQPIQMQQHSLHHSEQLLSLNECPLISDAI